MITAEVLVAEWVFMIGLRDKKLDIPLWAAWLELFGILLLLWFIMSGIFEFKFVIYALGTCITLSFLCLSSLYIKGIKTDTYYFLLHFHPTRFFSYFLWLLKEIVKSALDVAKVVLAGNHHIASQIIWFRADYDNPAARALLANSITLTPGTVTIDILDDGTYTVHALTDAAAEGLLTGDMQQKIARVYGETIAYEVFSVALVDELPAQRAHLVEGQRRKKVHP